MFWQTVKRCRKSIYTRVGCLNAYLQSRQNSKPLPLLSVSESSRKGRSQSLRTLPDCLVPPAYRYSEQIEKKHVSRRLIYDRRIDSNKRGPFSRRALSFPCIRSVTQHRNRRKSSFGQRGSSISIPRTSQSLPKGALIIAGGDGLPDIEHIRQLEGSLSLKMSECVSRLGGYSSLGFHVHTVKNGTGSGLSNLIDSTNSQFYLDNYLHESDLSGTEEFYEKVASDFKDLIIGWSDIAESICAAKRMENYFSCDGDAKAGVPGKPVILVSDYEDAVLRAERHLESFEALYRNRVNFVAKGNSNLGEQMKEREEQQSSNTLVIGKISSFLGDFFSNSRNHTTNDAFDQPWERSLNRAASVREPHLWGKIIPSDHGDKVTQPKNRNLCENKLLYQHILLANHSSYCFGSKAKNDSTQRSNRLLNRWISLYCLSESINTYQITFNDRHDDSTHVKEVDERKLFHTVIRQNVDRWTVDGVKRAEDWLKTMQSLEKSGWHNCGPSVDTYNLVLLGFCNLSKRFHSKRSKLAHVTAKKKYEIMDRQFILDGVERLLLELTEFKEGPNPNTMSLNLALNSIAKAGHVFPLTSCQRTNRIILNFFGEVKCRAKFMVIENKIESVETDCCLESVKQDVAQNETSISDTDPNLDTYHWLVDIYSTSGNGVYIMQGMTLLKRMIQDRIDQDSDHFICQNGSQNAPASFAPSSGTHNKVLHALVDLETADDIMTVMPNCRLDAIHDADRVKTAQEATELLDSMVQYVSSFPTPVTFLYMLQMWRKTNSPEAGDHAERILSRMEVVGIYQYELKSFQNAYVFALECWFTAAKAGRSGAAERAFRLLQMIEAQVSRDRNFPVSLSDGCETELFNRSMLSIRMYSVMLKICAATHEKQDMSQAMTISFEIHDKMIHGRINPSLRTYEMMYRCVKNFLDHHPEEEQQVLLLKVFEPASKHGITRGELIGRHKESLRKGCLAA